jgi:hypothetical protein
LNDELRPYDGLVLLGMKIRIGSNQNRDYIQRALFSSGKVKIGAYGNYPLQYYAYSSSPGVRSGEVCYMPWGTEKTGDSRVAPTKPARKAGKLYKAVFLWDEIA